MSDPITLEGKLLFPSEYIGAADLAGQAVTLSIHHVEISELRLQGGASQAKPVVYFQKTKKKLVLNKTNARAIAGLYGNAVEGWPGKRITLYPTRTRCGPSQVDCVRVREPAPPAAAAAARPQPAESPPSPTEDRGAAAEGRHARKDEDERGG